MRPTISALRSWRLDDLSTAGDTASTNAQQITDSAARIDRALLAAGTWTGHAQRSAKRTITADADHATEVCTVLQSIASTATSAKLALVPARDQVLSDVGRAVADGFHVSDTGDVTLSDDEESTDERTAQAQIWANRISAALTALDEVDARYGRKFAAHARDLASMVDGQQPITLPDGTKADPDAVVTTLLGMAPTARRAFLARLRDDDLRQLITANPEVMGNLDGVPFRYRIAANDINIRTALATEVSAGRGNGARAKKLTELLTPVAPVRPQIGDTGRVPRTFVAFRNTGTGHAIEMIGHLDSSTRNAVVYVPGTNTNLNGSRSNYESARNLAQRTGGPVFMYLDERLPQKMGHEKALPGLAIGTVSPAIGAGVTLGGLSDSAADASLAKAIAPELVSFGHELDTELQRAAPGATTTYIGHSYGGLVVGTAEQVGLRADKVIYASSAGSGAYSTGWHNANPDVERYSLTAPGDWIHTVQATERYGPDPDSMPGVTRLDTGYYSPGGSHAGALVSGDTHGHGDYWNDPDSTAFANMVAVVTGDPTTGYVHRADDTPRALTTGFDGARAATGATGAVGAAAGVEALRRWLASG